MPLGTKTIATITAATALATVGIERPDSYERSRSERVLRQTTTIVLHDLGRALHGAERDGLPYIVTALNPGSYQIHSDTNRNGKVDPPDFFRVRRLPSVNLGVKLSMPTKIVLGKRRDARIELVNDQGEKKVITYSAGRLGLEASA